MKLLERAATAEAADTLFCVASDPLTQFVLVLSGLIHNVRSGLLSVLVV